MRLAASALLLSLAWFGAINIAASAVAAVTARIALRRSRALGPAALLLLRLLPASAATLFVSVMFLPGHLRFEPTDSKESFGVVLLGLAASGAIILCRSLARAFQIATASARICRALRVESIRTGTGQDVYEIAEFPGISLAGAFRTRIIVGSGIRDALSPDELSVAIAHEEAHRISRDNLMRCMLFCAPDAFGWSRTARRLEQEWRGYAECLADSRAVAGDEGRAACLAAALVKVARLGTVARGPLHSPAWSTFHEPVLLEARVRRLLSGPAPAPPSTHRLRTPVAVAVVIASSLVLLNAGAAQQIHRATEALVKLLP